jgi:hypothetical protein
MTCKHHRKLFGLLLLASFLILVYAAGFHNHPDTTSHADCPICVAAQQKTVVSHQTTSLAVSHDIQVASCDFVPTLVSLRDRRPSFVRGPPA